MMNKQSINDNQQMQEINITRTNEFFISSANYVDFQPDIANQKKNTFNSIFFECTGHGSFNQDLVAQRFINHLAYCLNPDELQNYVWNQKFAKISKMKNQQQSKISKHSKIHPISQNKNRHPIEKIKIRLTGFDLSKAVIIKRKGKKSEQVNIIKQLCDLISPRLSQLISLQIRITHVTKCTLQQFRQALSLGIHKDSEKLNNLSCQFSDWTFQSQYLPSRKYQPTFSVLSKELVEVFSSDFASLNQLKRFRLEISTFYYTEQEYKKFLESIIIPEIINNQQQRQGKKEKFFHSAIVRLIDDILSGLMPNLEILELDFRNWFAGFEMNKLKSELLNIKNRDIVSTYSAILKKNQISNIMNKALTKMMTQSFINKQGKKMAQEQQEKLKKEEQVARTFEMTVVI